MIRFRELLALWRADNSLTQALNDSHAMLVNTGTMFRNSVQSLRESDSGEVGPNVYEQDQIINNYQQEVRRKVLKHLAMTGGVDISPGLILTSIVIDIERIGDYTKNIMDLAIAHPKRLVCGAYEQDIAEIESSVREIFGRIVPVLDESKRDEARRLINANWWVISRCDEIIIGLIKEEDPSLRSGDAVSTAMYTRYLKRIAAHLMNIASSVANPFEKVGFRVEEES